MVIIMKVIHAYLSKEHECDALLVYIGAETKCPPFPDDIFKCMFLNENALSSIKISLKFISKGPINNIQALVQVMSWHRPGDKALSEQMMVRLPTRICVVRPQLVLNTIQLMNLCHKPYTINFMTFGVLQAARRIHQGFKDSKIFIWQRKCMLLDTPSIFHFYETKTNFIQHTLR